jgi:hypothetical protein
VLAACSLGALAVMGGAASDAAPRPGALRLPDLFTVDGGPVSPGAAPRGLSGLAASDCATCHAEIAAEWAISAHAQSWLDPVFQAEYRLTRRAACRHCHAPLATAALASLPDGPGGPRSQASSRVDADTRGIDCAVCHIRDGHVLGVQGRGATDHAVRRDARLATTAFCGACHQFDFPTPEPGAPARYHPGRPQQNTVAEWAQSRFADRPCQACHMPHTGRPGRRHASHAFRTLDDPRQLARAVRVAVSARRRGATVQVTAVLAPGEIGHAFPTGDVFRQAVLTVRAGAVGRQAVLMRYFAQTMTDDASGHLLGQVDDTRVPPPGAGPPQRFELALDAPGAADVTWSLDLFRLAPDDARARGLDTVQGLRIASGTAPIAQARARHDP